MLVAVCSVKGSPGVTTLAVALAVRWPQPARRVVVECDPSGGDLATRFSLASSPGLMSLAAAARRRTDPAVLWRHAQRLPGGLPVVPAPPGADQAYAALAALTTHHSSDAGVLGAAAAHAGMVIIADCGRADPKSPVVPILRAADAMVLLCRAQADDLAHLVTRLTSVGRWSRRPALVLVGAGYSAGEVQRALRVPVLARVPDDGRGAAALRGLAAGRGPSRSRLGRAAARVAVALAAPSLDPRSIRPAPEGTSDAVHPPSPAPTAADAPLLAPESVARNGVRS